MFILFILLVVIFVYDEYIDKKGPYRYSVLIGIKDDDDSIEDYRFYANNCEEAHLKAINQYCSENQVFDYDIIIYAIEAI